GGRYTKKSLVKVVRLAIFETMRIARSKSIRSPLAKLWVGLIVAFFSLAQLSTGTPSAMAQTAPVGHDHAMMDMGSMAPTINCSIDDQSGCSHNDDICASICEVVCSVQAIDLATRYSTNHQFVIEERVPLPVSTVLSAFTAVEERPPRQI
ncbi:MAG: hypothetical protein WA921_13540, partial [Ahrensia sp.]